MSGSSGFGCGGVIGVLCMVLLCFGVLSSCSSSCSSGSHSSKSSSWSQLSDHEKEVAKQSHEYKEALDKMKSNKGNSGK